MALLLFGQRYSGTVHHLASGFLAIVDTFNVANQDSHRQTVSQHMMCVEIKVAPLFASGDHIYLSPVKPLAVNVHGLCKRLLHFGPASLSHLADSHDVVFVLVFVCGGCSHFWTSLVVDHHVAEQIGMGAQGIENRLLESREVDILGQIKKDGILIIILVRICRQAGIIDSQLSLTKRRFHIWSVVFVNQKNLGQR